LTNNNEVFILSLSSILLAAQQILMKFFSLFQERLNPKMGSENSQTNLKLAEHHRTPKTKKQKSAKRSSAYEASSVRPTSLKKSATLRAVRTAGPNTKFPPKIRSKHW
jgi:hypothetical protein